jgi:hypothetical protein
MKKFRATAFNEKGFTFTFFFKNENWVGIEDTARLALDLLVEADPLHQKNGPWNFRNIDVSA